MAYDGANQQIDGNVCSNRVSRKSTTPTISRNYTLNNVLQYEKGLITETEKNFISGIDVVEAQRASHPTIADTSEQSILSVTESEVTGAKRENSTSSSAVMVRDHIEICENRQQHLEDCHQGNDSEENSKGVGTRYDHTTRVNKLLAKKDKILGWNTQSAGEGSCNKPKCDKDTRYANAVSFNTRRSLDILSKKDKLLGIKNKSPTLGDTIQNHSKGGIDKSTVNKQTEKNIEVENDTHHNLTFEEKMTFELEKDSALDKVDIFEASDSSHTSLSTSSDSLQRTKHLTLNNRTPYSLNKQRVGPKIFGVSDNKSASNSKLEASVKAKGNLSSPSTFDSKENRSISKSKIDNLPSYRNILLKQESAVDNGRILSDVNVSPSTTRDDIEQHESTPSPVLASHSMKGDKGLKMLILTDETDIDVVVAVNGEENLDRNRKDISPSSPLPSSQNSLYAGCPTLTLDNEYSNSSDQVKQNILGTAVNVNISNRKNCDDSVAENPYTIEGIDNKNVYDVLEETKRLMSSYREKVDQTEGRIFTKSTGNNTVSSPYSSPITPPNVEMDIGPVSCSEENNFDATPTYTLTSANQKDSILNPTSSLLYEPNSNESKQDSCDSVQISKETIKKKENPHNDQQRNTEKNTNNPSPFFHKNVNANHQSDILNEFVLYDEKLPHLPSFKTRNDRGEDNISSLSVHQNRISNCSLDDDSGEEASKTSSHLSCSVSSQIIEEVNSIHGKESSNCSGVYHETGCRDENGIENIESSSHRQSSLKLGNDETGTSPDLGGASPIIDIPNNTDSSFNDLHNMGIRKTESPFLQQKGVKLDCDRKQDPLALEDSSPLPDISLDNDLAQLGTEINDPSPHQQTDADMNHDSIEISPDSKLIRSFPDISRDTQAENTVLVSLHPLTLDSSGETSSDSCVIKEVDKSSIVNSNLSVDAHDAKFNVYSPMASKASINGNENAVTRQSDTACLKCTKGKFQHDESPLEIAHDEMKIISTTPSVEEGLDGPSCYLNEGQTEKCESDSDDGNSSNIKSQRTDSFQIIQNGINNTKSPSPEDIEELSCPPYNPNSNSIDNSSSNGKFQCDTDPLVHVIQGEMNHNKTPYIQEGSDCPQCHPNECQTEQIKSDSKDSISSDIKFERDTSPFQMKRSEMNCNETLSVENKEKKLGFLPYYSNGCQTEENKSDINDSGSDNQRESEMNYNKTSHTEKGEPSLYCSNGKQTKENESDVFDSDSSNISFQHDTNPLHLMQSEINRNETSFVERRLDGQQYHANEGQIEQTESDSNDSSSSNIKLQRETSFETMQGERNHKKNLSLKEEINRPSHCANDSMQPSLGNTPVVEQTSLLESQEKQSTGHENKTSNFTETLAEPFASQTRHYDKSKRGNEPSSVSFAERERPQLRDHFRSMGIVFILILSSLIFVIAISPYKTSKPLIDEHWASNRRPSAISNAPPAPSYTPTVTTDEHWASTRKPSTISNVTPAPPNTPTDTIDVWKKVGSVQSKEVGDKAGYSLSMTRDGTRIVVGAPRHSQNFGYHAGAVRTYDLINGAWILVGEIAGQYQDDQFGASVSISNDGKKLAVGAPGYDIYREESNTGKVYLYNIIDEVDDSSGLWSESLSVTGDEIGGQLGYSVSFDPGGHGYHVAMGAPHAKTQTGMVSIYMYAGNSTHGGWYRVGMPVMGTNTFDNFGQSVSLSMDGKHLAVGALSTNGYVNVYRFHHDKWQLFGHLTGQSTDGKRHGISNVEFGYSVSMSTDGSLLAIGSPGFNVTDEGSNEGRVYIYNISALVEGSEMLIENLTITGYHKGRRLGSSLSFSTDGHHLAIGSPSNERHDLTGSVQVVQISSDPFSGELKHEIIGGQIEGNRPLDLFGSSVSLSGIGQRLAVGAPDASSGDSSGCVTHFEYFPTNET